MAAPLFTLTSYEITWILRAPTDAVLAQRLAALAARYGTSAKAIKDAVWATGTILGNAGRSAMARAGAQSLARGAAQRLAQAGGRTALRQAGRHLAAHGARAAGAKAAGGLGALLGGLGTALTVGAVVVVLAGGAYAAHRIYTTMQERSAASADAGSVNDPGSGGGGATPPTTPPSGSAMTDVRGHWKLDHGLMADDLIRKGVIDARDRGKVISSYRKQLGSPVMTISSGGRVISRARIGSFAGTWQRSGSTLTVRRGGWSGRFKIGSRFLTTSRGKLTLFYRRA